MSGEQARLMRQIAALRDALLPFAKAADPSGFVPDDWLINQHTGITHRDLRRAAAILAQSAGENNDG